MVLAGMFSAGSLGSSGFGGCGVGVGGFTIGTLSLSCPCSSAFFGGSCIWLPPPPPPPPGPGVGIQMIELGSSCLTGLPMLGRGA